MTIRRLLNKSVRRTTLVVLTCSILFLPTYAVSAERDGTVIYFTFEDVKQMFSYLSLLPGLSDSSWRNQRERTSQQRPIARTYRWNNGQGSNGSPLPETRPLWGYAPQNTE